MFNRQLQQMAHWASLGLLGLSALERRIPRKSYTSSVPNDARHWHNPADPVQAARIEAAAARREERADRRVRCACRSRNYNHAHLVQHRDPGATLVRYEFPNRFNPFHVAH